MSKLITNVKTIKKEFESSEIAKRHNLNDFLHIDSDIISHIYPELNLDFLSKSSTKHTTSVLKYKTNMPNFVVYKSGAKDAFHIDFDGKIKEYADAEIEADSYTWYDYTMNYAISLSSKSSTNKFPKVIISQINKCFTPNIEDTLENFTYQTPYRRNSNSFFSHISQYTGRYYSTQESLLKEFINLNKNKLEGDLPKRFKGEIVCNSSTPRVTPAIKSAIKEATNIIFGTQLFNFFNKPDNFFIIKESGGWSIKDWNPNISISESSWDKKWREEYMDKLKAYKESESLLIKIKDDKAYLIGVF